MSTLHSQKHTHKKNSCLSVSKELNVKLPICNLFPAQFLMHSALPEMAMLSCRPSQCHVLPPLQLSPVQSLPHKLVGRRAERRGRLEVSNAIAAPPDHRPVQSAEGHSALLQGLGELGDVTPGLMPGLLRLSHIRYVDCIYTHL